MYVCVAWVKLVYAATRRTKPAFVLSASLGVILSLPLSRESARAYALFYVESLAHLHIYANVYRRTFVEFQPLRAQRLPIAKENVRFNDHVNVHREEVAG